MHFVKCRIDQKNIRLFLKFGLDKSQYNSGEERDDKVIHIARESPSPKVFC